ncbi:MAG: hypothetical protein JWL83_417 [Actinomycetia bacterium]|nr:hypothetical protein [Actinomycetes bacterium]
MSHCYLCNRGINAIPTREIDNRPVGACAICGVFACEGHALRDANLRKLRCAVCVPALLTASALVQSDRIRVRPEHQVAIANDQLVSTLDEFLATAPEYAPIVRELTQGLLETAPKVFTDDLTEPLWSSMPPESRRLLAAAAAIAKELHLPPSDVPVILEELMRRWL